MANYDINYDDQRFKEVEADKKTALSENQKMYQGMINESDKYYQAQIDASKQWADTQSKLQQEKTDFAIQKIEQEKDQAQKDYTKEQSGAYVDWQKQSNEYGVNSEQAAAQGMSNTGWSESSQVSMYNTYQNRVATARESFNRIVLDFNNQMTEARLQNNSILAEIAFETQKQQLELNLQRFNHKNNLLIELANKKMEIDNIYHNRYQDVLAQINQENALAEQIRQYNESMALEREQFEWQKEQAAKSYSGGGGGGYYSGGGDDDDEGGKITGTKKTIKNGNENLKQVNKKSDGSSNAPKLDTKSVVKAGYAGASGTKIAKAVNEGKLTAKVENNKVVVKPSANKIINSMKYSSRRF